MSESSNAETRMEALAERYLEQLQAGQSPDRQTMLAANPDIAEALERRLALVELVFRAAPPSEEARAAVNGERTLRIKCPHCGNGIQLVTPEPQEVTCLNCGSSFQVDARPTAAVASTDLPRLIGKFTVLERLGRGTFGAVYKCLDPELQRTVAVKVPRAGVFHSPEEQERFLREARSAAQLQHASIVQVHEVGHEQGLPYIVSDYIEGLTLADLLTGGRPSYRQAAEMVAELADALEYAHQAKVIHRDIKPSNILLDRQGRPHLADFGLARRDEGEITVTVEGQILGTPAYMCPEQAAGESRRVDARSDVYSLGVVLYELLTGELPFRGNKRMLLHQVLHDEPRSPRRINDHIPRDLETICLKAMAKEPHKRYARAQELANDLSRWLKGEPIQARPIGQTERLWRWCRRKPVVAGLTATVLVLLASAAVIATVAAIIIDASRQRAETSAGNERLAKDDATTAKNVAIQKATEAKDAQGREAKERQKAERAADQSQERLGRHYVENGQRLLRSDLFGAMLWFGEAARWDRDNPERAKLHQIRLTAYLNQSPRLVHVLQVQRGGGNLHLSAAFTADGQRLITTSGGQACVWDLAAGALAFAPLEHRGPNEAVLSTHGRRLVTISKDGEVQVWDTRTGKMVVSPLRMNSKIENVQLTADGRRILTTSWNSKPKALRVWDVETGKPVSPIEEFPDWLQSIFLSPDGQMVGLAGGGFQRIVDVVSGQAVVEMKDSQGGVLQFTPDGRQFVLAGSSSVRVFDLATKELVETLHEVRAGAEFFARFSPDGRYVLVHAFRSEKEGREVRVWDTTTWKPACEPLRCNLPSVAFFSPDSKRVLTRSTEEVVVWNIATGKPTIPPLKLSGKWEDGHAIFSPDSRFVALRDGSTARVHDASNGEPIVPQLTHPSKIRALAFSPDGRFLATGGEEGTVRVWDFLPVLEGPPNALGLHPVTLAEVRERFRFSSDGRQARTLSLPLLKGTSGTGPNQVRVSDGEGTDLFPPLRHLERVWQANFSPDGRQLLTLGGEASANARVLGREARVWAAETGQTVTPPMTHGDLKIVETRLSPDGRYVVSREADGTVRFWDATDGWPIESSLQVKAERLNVWFGRTIPLFFVADDLGTVHVLQGVGGGRPPLQLKHGARIRQVTSQLQAADKKSIAIILTAGEDGLVRFWDARTGTELYTPLKHDGPVTHVEISPIGTIATASADKTARLWLPRTQKPRTPPLQHDSEVIQVALNLGGRQVLTVCKDGTVKLWNSNTGAPSEVQLKNPGIVRQAVWSGVGRVALIGDQEARFWNPITGEPMGEPVKFDREMQQVKTDPSLNFMRLLTLGKDGTAQVWDLNTGRRVGAPVQLDRTAAEVVLFGSSSCKAVSTTGTLWDWAVEINRPLSSLNLSLGMTDARYSPDGKRILTTGNDGSVRLWDAASGQLLLRMQSTRPVQKALFSPDGRYVVALPALSMWDATTGHELPPLQEALFAQQVVFSPDGRCLLASDNRLVRGWELATGQPITGAMMHEYPLRSVSFSLDGQKILTVCYQSPPSKVIVVPPPDNKSLPGEARVWDAATGKAITAPLRHKSGPVTDAKFSPDGKRVLTSGGGEARVWDAALGQPITPPLAPAGHLASFSPDGRLILTTGNLPATTSQGPGPAAPVQLWDSSTGQPITPPLMVGRVADACFSIDGRQVVLLIGSRVRTVDLSPLPLALDDLLLLVQLRSSRSLDVSGDFLPYDLEKFNQDYKAVRSRYPEEFRYALGERLAWNREQAQKYEAARNWPLARMHLDYLIAAEPTDATLLARRGSVLAALQEWELSLADYNKAVVLNAEKAPYWHGRGQAQAALNQWEHARESFTKAIELGANDWGVWSDRGKVLARLDRWDLASADLDKALQQEKVSLSLYEWQALICLKRRDANGYRRTCEALLKNFSPTGNLVGISQVVRLCVLGPDGLADFAPLLQMIESHRTPVGLLGPALYRAGRSEEAAKKLAGHSFPQDDTNLAGYSLGLIRTEADLFRAMALHQSGQHAEARKLLALTGELLEQRERLKTEPLHGPELPGRPLLRAHHLHPLPWERQLAIELLRREAENLVKEKTP